MDLSKKNFLIAGATGRLGCEMVRRLKELGGNVFPLVLIGGYKHPKRIKWPLDISPILVKKDKINLISPGNYVINFHWKTDRSLSFTNQLKYDLDHSLFNNTFFWEWLADNKIEKFINISSMKIFSHLNEEPITASSCPKPISPYGIAKTLSESYFNQLFNKSSAKAINVRLSSVTSVGEHPTHLISQMYKSAFLKSKMTVNISHKSYLLYIEEAIDLIIATALYGNEPQYNFGGKGFLNEEIAAEFEKISNKKLTANYKNLNSEVKESIYLFDNDKFKQEFIRKFTLQELLNAFINNSQLKD